MKKLVIKFTCFQLVVISDGRVTKLAMKRALISYFYSVENLS